MLAEIPAEWKDVVCQCPKVWYDERPSGYPARRFTFDDTRIFTCVECSKPSSHCIYACTICSSIFLKDFSHPRWLLDSPRCWVCCEQDIDRATTILLGGKVQEYIAPTLRYLYIHITEGFKPVSLFDM